MSAPVLKFKPVALALAFAFPMAAFGAAGRIDYAVGDVKAVGPDGRTRPLAKGDEFDSGDTIETGDGRVWLRFTDGAQVSLQPQSQYRIDNYKYSGQADGGERGFFSLLKGGLRTITGWVGRTNRDNYRVTTAVATIGIRGTEFSITYVDSIVVATGEGKVAVCNNGGCLDLTGGEAGYVANIDTKPVLISKKPYLPPPPPLPDPTIDYSVADNPNAAGGAAMLTLLPGPGYAMAVGSNSTLIAAGAPITTLGYAGTAGFDTSLGLTSLGTSTGTGPTDVGTDGVVGWGRWTTATLAGVAGARTSISYVVGVPTAAASMPQGGAATYVMTGGTSPVSGAGVVGTLYSASLTANFTNLEVAGTLATSFGNASFSGIAITAANSTFTGRYTATAPTVNVSGFFSGPAASRAAMTYSVDPGGGVPFTYSGAVAFRQP